MAVCASDHALFDLGLDDRDRRAFPYKRADVVTFPAPYVVELHDDRIEKSAIDARMREQMVFDEAAIPRAVEFKPVALPCVVLRVIRPIISATVSTPAGSANRMNTSSARIADWVFGLILHDTAPPTPFHVRIIARHDDSIMARSEAWRARRESNPHRSA